MSLPSYAEYKESGLPWAELIPTGWRTARTKQVCTFSTGWTPPTGDASSYEGENLWANISDLGPKRIGETAKRISDSAVSKAGLRLSPARSLLFSFKLSVGQVSFVDRPMYTNEAIATFHESQDLSLAFAYYAFPIFLLTNAAENIYGAKLLNQELIRSARFPLPSKGDQQAIASFLDRETAKIDTLIAEQEILLALLAEKRQATISHAVIRGLDPDVPMKDSGVAWLGEVPAHWKVHAFRRQIERGLSNGIFKKKHEFGAGVLLANVLDIYRRDFKIDCATLDRVLCTKDEMEAYRLEAGDLLFVRSSLKQEGIGVVAVAETCGEPLVYECHLIRARPNATSFDGRYGSYLFNSTPHRQHLVRSAKVTTMTTIDQEAILGTPVPVPPLTEQRAIVRQLEDELDKIDSVEVSTKNAIRLLKERRSALIAAAVTGKIDVRGLAE